MRSSNLNSAILEQRTHKQLKKVLASLNKMETLKSPSWWNLWQWGKTGYQWLYLWYQQKRYNKSPEQVMKEDCHTEIQEAFKAIKKIKANLSPPDKEKTIKKVNKQLSKEITNIAKKYGYSIEQTLWRIFMLNITNKIRSLFNLPLPDSSTTSRKSHRRPSNNKTSSSLSSQVLPTPIHDDLLDNTNPDFFIKSNQQNKNNSGITIKPINRRPSSHSNQTPNVFQDNLPNQKESLSVVLQSPKKHPSTNNAIQDEKTLRQEYKRLLNHTKTSIDLIEDFDTSSLRDEEAIKAALQLLSNAEKSLNNNNLPLKTWLKQCRNQFLKKFHPDRKQNQSDNHNSLKYKVSIHTHNKITTILVEMFEAMLKKTENIENNDPLKKNNDLLKKNSDLLKEQNDILKETISIMKEISKMTRESSKMIRERTEHLDKLIKKADKQMEGYLIMIDEINKSNEVSSKKRKIEDARITTRFARLDFHLGEQQFNIATDPLVNLDQSLLQAKKHLEKGPILSTKKLCSYLKRDDTPFFPLIQHWFPNGLIRGNTDYVKTARALWAINDATIRIEGSKVEVHTIKTAREYKLKQQQGLRALPPEVLLQQITHGDILLPVFEALFPDYTINGVNYEALLRSRHQDIKSSYVGATTFLEESSLQQSKTVNKQTHPVVVLQTRKDKSTTNDSIKHFDGKINLFKLSQPVNESEHITAQPTLAPEIKVN